MKTKSMVLLAMLLTLAISGISQDKQADFSGKWKLDPAKSDFGMLPPVESQTNVIEHKDPKLKITSTVKGAQAERTTESNYTTDGKETTNTQGPREIKTVAKWDGKKIVMVSKFEMQGAEIELNDTYSLTEDGKGMTINRSFKSPMGEGTQTLVFTKAE
jgi:hypothetical protein